MELTIAAVTLGVLCVAFALALASRGLLSAEESLWTSSLYYLAAGVVLVLTFFACSFILALAGVTAISAAQ